MAKSVGQRVKYVCTSLLKQILKYYTRPVRRGRCVCKTEYHCSRSRAIPANSVRTTHNEKIVLYGYVCGKTNMDVSESHGGAHNRQTLVHREHAERFRADVHRRHRPTERGTLPRTVRWLRLDENRQVGGRGHFGGFS